MLEFSASTSIAAPPDTVWRTLLDTDRWTAWDQNLQRVEGELAPNGRITIHVRDSKRPFKLRVATWQPQQLIELRGGMPLGLFVGTRTHRLVEQSGSTTFEMTERYTGLLAPLVTKSIPDLQPSFDAFVAGLRTAATV